MKLFPLETDLQIMKVRFCLLVPLVIILFIESIKVSSPTKMMIDLTACLPTAPEVSEVHGNCLSGAGV